MRILLKKNIYIHIYILLNNQKKNLVYSLQELFSFISEKRKIKSIKNNIYLNKKLNISIIDYVILIYNLNKEKKEKLKILKKKEKKKDKKKKRKAPIIQNYNINNENNINNSSFEENDE